MKKLFLTLLAAMLIIPAASAGEPEEGKGLISDWKFVPLQIDAGVINNRRLADCSIDTALSFGVFILDQKSAVLSVALVANKLQNNYGIQLNPLFLGTATDNNYGISWGVENYSKKCYGIQLGIINRSFAGDKIEKDNERLQFCGINISDTLYLALINFSNEFQIGLFNFSKGAVFQLGVLNYNPKSYIPWLPLINFDMGR